MSIAYTVYACVISFIKVEVGVTKNRMTVVTWVFTGDVKKTDVVLNRLAKDEAITLWDTEGDGAIESWQEVCFGISRITIPEDK